MYWCIFVFLYKKNVIIFVVENKFKFKFKILLSLNNTVCDNVRVFSVFCNIISSSSSSSSSSLVTENHQRTDVYFPAYAW